MADVGIRVIVSGVAEARRNLGAINSDVATLGKTIQSVSGVTSQLGTTLQNVGSALTAAGRTMTIAVTAPIAAMGATAIQAGIEFEAAFAGVGKTVEGVATSTGELTALGQQIREEFRQMALDIPIATNELVALGEVVGQLGVQAESVAEVTEIIAMLGATTELSAEEAAKGLIHFANILGVTAKDAAAFEDFLLSAGSAVVALGNASVSTEGEILNLALRLAAAGDRAKFTAPEILAWATTLSDLGVRAEAGGSAVSRAINEMVLAVQTGSDNLGTFAEVSGKTIDQFVKDFSERGSQALLDFVTSLEEGIRTGRVTEQMLNDMGLAGIRAMDILGRLGDAEEIFTKNLEVANMAWEEQIALQEEFNKRSATVQAQIQLLKNAFTDLGIEIFDLVKEDITNLLLGLRNLIKGFKELDPNIQKTILVFAGLAAAIGPILIIAGALISTLGLVISGIAAIASPAGLAITAALGLSAALGTLIVPGLIAGLGAVLGNIEEISRTLGFLQMPNLGEPVNATQAEQVATAQEQPVIPTFDRFLEGVRKLAGDDVASAINNINRIGKSFGDIFERLSQSETVQRAMSSIQEALGRIGETVINDVLGGLENFADFMENNEGAFVAIGEGIAIAAGAVFEFAAAIAEFQSAIRGGVVDSIIDIGNAIGKLFEGDTTGAAEELAGVLDNIAEAAGRIGTAVLEAGINIANLFSGDNVSLEEFQSTWEGIGNNVGLIFEQLGIKFEQGAAFWSGIINTLGTSLSVGWERIKQNASDALNGFIEIVTQSAVDAAAGFGASVGTFAGHAATFIQTSIDNFVSGIATFVAETTGAAVDAAAGFAASVGEFAAAGAAFISDAAANFAAGVGDFLAKVGNAAGDAASDFAGVAGDFEAAGASFIQGAIAGIEGMIGALVDAVAGAAAEAAGAFDLEWLNFSPSHVAEESGFNFIQGAIVGIEGQIKALSSMASDAASTSASAFESALLASTPSLSNELLLAVSGVASSSSNVSNSQTNINQTNHITGAAANSPNLLAQLLNQELQNVASG